MRFSSHASKGAKKAERQKLSSRKDVNFFHLKQATLKMSEAKTERGTLWGDDEVMALIEIWADEGIQQQLDSCTRKRPIFEKIARRLQEEGEYIRTFVQVREKIKQLKQAYKKVKDSNNKSGNNRKTFKHFESIDKILGDRPITRPGSLLESVQLENDANETDSFEDDSDAATESPHMSGPSKGDTDSLSLTCDDELDLSEGENITSTPALKKVDAKVEKSDKVLSSRRGKSKKRSRNEAFVASVCEMIHKQQEAADDRFFKMEEERQKNEIEREEKRRQDERQHEMMMMRIMADMFSKVSSNFGNFQGPSYNQMQQGQNFFPTSQPHMPHHPHQSSYNMFSNSEQQEEDSIYSNNF